MKTKTPPQVTIDGTLYDEILAFLKGTENEASYNEVFELREARGRFREGMAIAHEHLTKGRDRLAGELASVVEDDWCDDDGSGYCSNHDAYIAYVVSDFGPNGVVLKTWDEDAIRFDVCTKSNRYDPDLDK